MTQQDDLSGALRDSGRRLTRQRRLVMDILKESKGHLDVDALYRQAKARDPRISLPTIYRTLAVLKEMGLVEEQSLGEDHAHYEAVKASPHYHFTCLKCGRVIEFAAPQVLRAVRALSKREQLQVTSIQLFLGGYCSCCRKQGGKTDGANRKR